MKARKAALRVYHRHAILNWVAFTEAPVKSLLPRPNLETICIIHVAHHDTHTMHNGNVGVKGAHASRTSAVRTEKTSADECEEVGSLAPVFIATPPHLTPCLFLTLSPPPPTFLLHFSSFSFCSLAPHPLSCLLQIPPFHQIISLPGLRRWFIIILL